MATDPSPLGEAPPLERLIEQLRGERDIFEVGYEKAQGELDRLQHLEPNESYACGCQTVWVARCAEHRRRQPNDPNTLALLKLARGYLNKALRTQERDKAMIPIVFRLTWQTRTANLEGELHGSVVNDHHKQLLLTDLSVRGFRAEDVSDTEHPFAALATNIVWHLEVDGKLAQGSTQDASIVALVESILVNTLHAESVLDPELAAQLVRIVDEDVR